jgi:hypothetical protein
MGLLAAEFEGFVGKVAGRSLPSESPALRTGGLTLTPSCSRESSNERFSILSNQNAVCRLTLGAETKEEVDRSPGCVSRCLELKAIQRRLAFRKLYMPRDKSVRPVDVLSWAETYLVACETNFLSKPLVDKVGFSLTRP